MYDFSKKPESELQFIQVCTINDIPRGERLFFSVGDESLVLLNIEDKYYAIADKCSHDDGPLGDGEIDKCEIICPRHGARFDITNGQATKMPAMEDIPAYPVRIMDNIILVGFPR